MLGSVEQIVEFDAGIPVDREHPHRPPEEGGGDGVNDRVVFSVIHLVGEGLEGVTQYEDFLAQAEGFSIREQLGEFPNAGI